MPSRFFDRTTHSVPLFDGERSRRHHNVPVWKLNFEGIKAGMRYSENIKSVQSFVQFLGFPRSGHSLIGPILDAHPGAIISHELDTMGLIQKTLSEKIIYGLIIQNTVAFTQNGRYWNGFPYVVPGQPHGRSDNLLVIGDKKGDLAVRRYREDPELLVKLSGSIRAESRWILVTRNPMDNIATMSLRKNRAYDQLRISVKDNNQFREQLKEHQQTEKIASKVDDDTVSDYSSLCEGITEMSRKIPGGCLYHIVYEDFCSNPIEEIKNLCRFLNLDPDPKFVESSASIIRTSLNKSRNKINWTGSQKERVRSLVKNHDFLKMYEPDLETDD